MTIVVRTASIRGKWCERPMRRLDHALSVDQLKAFWFGEQSPYLIKQRTRTISSVDEEVSLTGSVYFRDPVYHPRRLSDKKILEMLNDYI